MAVITHHRFLKIILLLLLVIAISSITFLFHQYFSLQAIQQLAIDAQTYVDQYPNRSLLAFMAFYFCICALPTAFVSVFTMMAGYLFGHTTGLLAVSFMSALGGSLLFITVRYLLAHWVQEQLKNTRYLRQAIQTDSFTVALSIRFIPALPFSFPAIALALSNISLWKFYLSTQAGLLLTLFVYVNAGHSLSQIHSIADIFSPVLIGSMLLLAALPLSYQYLAKHRSVFSSQLIKNFSKA